MCGKATQPFCFIKPTIIKKLAYVVKYITQFNGGLIKIFWKFENKIFFELVGSVVNNMEKINTRKRNTINWSVFKVLGQLSYYLVVTDTLKIPLIFIFLSCFEKVRDNKHFFKLFFGSPPPSQNRQTYSHRILEISPNLLNMVSVRPSHCIRVDSEGTRVKYCLTSCKEILSSNTKEQLMSDTKWVEFVILYLALF